MGAIQTTGTSFQINKAKLYVSAVTLSSNDNIKFVETIKEGFKRIISLNKYRSEITTQAENNNLDYLIGPAFRNCDNNSTRNSFDEFYLPLVEIKDFNPLIDNKRFFNHYIPRNLLDYLHCQ